MYDAIVIGARCAGSPTAMLLARKGYRVLLVDRATFPSDTISTHFIQPEGVERLRGWGLLEAVRATNCPDLSPPRTTLNGVAVPFGPADAIGLAPRRTVLDKLLLDAARDAGAEVREGFSVREIILDGERVTGIRGQSRDGEKVDADARIVVGADGKSSIVAETIGAEEYNVRASTTCGYYSYWKTETPIEHAELHIKNKRGVFIFPTNDGEVCVGSEWCADEWDTFRADPEANILLALDSVSEIAPRVRAGMRTEKIFGMKTPHSFYRKPFGPGWALVGDAGYHKDPVTGIGITDSFRDAQLLADVIDAGFAGKQPLEEALAGYQQQRDAATQLMYEVTAQLATLDPSEGLIQMIAGGAPAPA